MPVDQFASWTPNTQCPSIPPTPQFKAKPALLCRRPPARIKFELILSSNTRCHGCSILPLSKASLPQYQQSCEGAPLFPGPGTGSRRRARTDLGLGTIALWGINFLPKKLSEPRQFLLVHSGLAEHLFASERSAQKVHKQSSHAASQASLPPQRMGNGFFICFSKPQRQQEIGPMV